MKFLLPLLPMVPLLALAGEHTVAPAPFKVTLAMDGVLLPETAHPFEIDPKAWSEFKILDVKAQGAPVKQGEAVVRLDTKAIDRQIADSEAATTLRKMALANAELDLANLEASTAWKLEAAERAYTRTKEDIAYFKKVGQPLAVESTKRSLDRAERTLEYQEEELAQLLKMYEEDDLTEETEEIILKRQKNSVVSAKFGLKQARISCAHTLETELPRRAVDLAQGSKDADLAWTTSKETLPRALEQKRLEVKQLRVADARADETQAEILADRKLLDQKSPFAGRVYHGEIRNGRWSVGATAKFMKPGGAIPPRTVFATVVPDDRSLMLSAFVGEEAIGQLKEGQKGYLKPAAAPRVRLAVTVRELDRYPGVDGKYHVVLKPVLAPAHLPLVTGMKGSVTLTTYQADAALAVPAKALHEEADGTFSVQIKLADGLSEKRAVTTGAESEGMVEILSGLETGQVVLLENAETK
jgi:HlyD family secretion protein